MSEIQKPFEVNIKGREYLLALGNCAVVMYREAEKSHLDYLVIDEGEDDPTREFNCIDMVHWLAGYIIRKEEDGELMRYTTLYEGSTFRTAYGWNPPVIEKDAPADWEEEMYLEFTTNSLDREWNNFTPPEEEAQDG